MQKLWAYGVYLARMYKFPIACVPLSIALVVSVISKDERAQKRAVANKNAAIRYVLVWHQMALR
jgi:hypothetical protein